MNKQLIQCCHELSTDYLEKETHSFFPNIISYWNHLLFGDLILLKRLVSNNISDISLEEVNRFPEPKSPNDIYHTQLSEIAVLRKEVDTVIENFFKNLDESDFFKEITYTTTEGDIIKKCVADVCHHMFHHQTHLRGQLTCILSQFNIDFGCTDLLVLVPEGSQT